MGTEVPILCLKKLKLRELLAQVRCLGNYLLRSDAIQVQSRSPEP